MLALSIRQPWAWLIVRPDLAGEVRHAARVAGLLKDVENRTWSTSHRGPFLLHASKGMTRDEYGDAADFAGAWQIDLPAPEHLQRGGIVGRADLIRCLTLNDARSNWHVGEYGFYLANVEPLPFHPCRGQLGFFDVPWPPAAQEGS